MNHNISVHGLISDGVMLNAKDAIDHGLSVSGNCGN